MVSKTYSINFDQQYDIVIDDVFLRFSSGSNTHTWIYGLTYRVGMIPPSSLEELVNYSYTTSSKLFLEGEYAAVKVSDGIYALVRIIDSSSMNHGDSIYGVKFSVETLNKLPSYSITPMMENVKEGEELSFSVFTKNIVAGTSLKYSLSGISSEDIVGGLLSGSTIVGTDGFAKISIPIAADQLTEGEESLVISLEGTTATVKVIDNSLSQVPESRTEVHELTVIVNPGVLGNGPVILRGIQEILEYKSGVLQIHTLNYAGSIYNYDAVDPLIMTITRDGNFTKEFRNEIIDLSPAAADLSYVDLVKLIGLANIDQALIHIAGADGSYVI